MINNQHLLKRHLFQLAQSYQKDQDGSLTKDDQQTKYNLFEQIYTLDLSDKSYDLNKLINMYISEKGQYDSKNKFLKHPENYQERVKDILQQIAEKKFKTIDDDENPISILKIKLQTLKFMEIMFVEGKITSGKEIDFYVCTSFCLSTKCYDILKGQNDMIDWISNQQVKDEEYWNAQILKFENFIYEKVNWNVDLITSKNHFQEFDCAEIKNKCEKVLLHCYYQQKWSGFSSVIACLRLIFKYYYSPIYSQYLKFLTNIYAHLFLNTKRITVDLDEIECIYQYLKENVLYDDDENEIENQQENEEEEIQQQLQTPEQHKCFTEQENIQTQEIRTPDYDSMEAQHEDFNDSSTEQNEHDEHLYSKQQSCSVQNNEKVYNRKRSSCELYESHRRNTIKIDRNNDSSEFMNQSTQISDEEEQFENNFNKKQKFY